MSFLTDLNTGCSAYTAFTYNGSSIKLPYYLGDKKTPDQIRTAIANWGGSSKTTTEIQTYVSNNHCHPFCEQKLRGCRYQYRIRTL